MTEADPLTPGHWHQIYTGPGSVNLSGTEWKEPEAVRLPVTSVKVGPLMYRVSDRAIFDEDGEDLLGQCNNIEQEIIINLRQHRTMEAVRTTWYHELVHAVLYTYGLDSHNLSDDFQSENFVEQLGTGLHILIQDNPGVFNV